MSAMMHGSMMVFWFVLLVTLIAGVVAAIVALSRQSGRNRGASLEVLGERYAAGEIDEEEFRRRRRLLEER